MGLFRKTTSLFTMGAIDWRSDKERTAAYARGVRHQARKQTKLLKQQSRMQAEQVNWEARLLANMSPPSKPPAMEERERYDTWSETKAKWKAAWHGEWID
jgi:hypothetical protein